MCGSWLSFSALATVLCAVASSLPFDDGFSGFSLSSSQQFHDFFDSDDESNGGFENPVKEYVRTRRRIQGGPPSNFRPEDVFDIERPLFDTADPDDRRNPRPVQERNPAHAEIDGLRPLPIQRPFDDGPPGRSQSSGNPSFQKLEPVFHQSVQPEGPYDPQYSRSPEETRSATDGRLPRDPSPSQRLNPGDANEAQPPQYDAQPQTVKYHPHFSYTEPPQQQFSQVDNSQQHPGLFQAEENKQRVDDRSRVHISPAYYDDFLEKQQEELQLYRPQNEDKRREHSDQRQQQYQHQQESRQEYQQPQRPYEQPRRPFEQEQQTYEQPQRPFEQGQQTYEQPRRPFEQEQTFEQPRRPFEQGQQTFEQPRRPFEQGQQTYEQPQEQRSPLFYEEIRGVEQPPRDRDTPQLHNSESVLKASDQQSFAKKQAPRHSAYNYKTKKPVPLQPVYSKDQPPSFRDETRPVSITGRVHENEVLFDHLPEYQETFRDNSPVGESKEKRQALHGHGGGYMDHNGLEFAAAASAAEHAHGKGGDGRLTFQLHGQKGPHSYRFGFDTGKGPHRQFRYEERDNDGTVKGRYGYYDSHGKLQMYNYSAHPDHGYEAAEAH